MVFSKNILYYEFKNPYYFNKKTENHFEINQTNPQYNI